MTDPAPETPAAPPRIHDLLTELLAVEARMVREGKIGALLRAKLQERAEQVYRDDGAAPTWRADIGTCTLPVSTAGAVVQDKAKFAEWAAENHPEQVTATVKVAAADLE